MSKSKKYAQVNDFCVACGSCVKVCPLGAISVFKGIIARVNIEKCIGCGKCASTCPAGAISLRERGANNEN